MMKQVKGLNPAAMDIEVLELGGISVPNPVVLPMLEAGLSVLNAPGGLPFLHQQHGSLITFSLNNRSMIIWLLIFNLINLFLAIEN